MSSRATGPPPSASDTATAIAPESAPGAIRRSNTRWSFSQAGSEGNTSVSNVISPRADSCRTPSRGCPAPWRERFGALSQ